MLQVVADRYEFRHALIGDARPDDVHDALEEFPAVSPHSAEKNGRPTRRYEEMAGYESTRALLHARTAGLH